MRVRPAALLIAATMLTATAALSQDTPPAPGEPGSTSSGAGSDANSSETAAEREERLEQEKELDRLKREKELVTARKDLRNERLAYDKAAFGPLADYTGASGDVKISTAKAPFVEAALLSSRSLDEIGMELGRRLAIVVSDLPPPIPPATNPVSAPGAMSQAQLCSEIRAGHASTPAPGARPVVIVSEAATALTDLAESFDISSASVGRELCAALQEAARAKPGKNGALVEVEGGSIGLGTLATGVNTLAKLFRADYEIGGVDVPKDQKLLTRSVALSFMAGNGSRNPVYLPELFPVSGYDPGNSAMRRLAVLDALRAHAETSLATDANERLADAVKAYDTALGSLATPTADKPPALGAIVRQARVRDLLGQGAVLVVTNVQMMGGTAYTKKNFFTFLGGMPYFVSGGALGGYAVQDSLTGRTLDTFTMPVAGGYHRANRLHETFNAEAAQYERPGVPRPASAGSASQR